MVVYDYYLVDEILKFHIVAGTQEEISERSEEHTHTHTHTHTPRPKYILSAEQTWTLVTRVENF